MRKAYSYEGILSAVGRVLDEAGVKRIAIQDTGDSLLIEGFDAAGQQQVALRYDVPALFALLGDEQDQSAAHRVPADADETLRHFLANHELVGAR